MASRKQKTQEALTGAAKGWENQFGEAPPIKGKEKPKLQRKTYLVSEELASRLDTTAKQYNVGVNELLRYLLTKGLDEVNSGAHKLPVRVVTHYTLDV